MALPALMAFTGYKGHGKDTAAFVLTEFHGYQRINFADALKSMIATMLRYGGMNEGTIYRCLEGDMKEVPLPQFDGQSARHMMQTLGTEWGWNLISPMKEVPLPQFDGQSARHMMQTLGTEWGRNLISPYLWLSLFQNRAKEVLAHRPVCVTDLRFMNEAKLIHGMKGVIVHVHDARKRHTDVHASENEVFQIEADITLDNDGTVQELHEDLMAKLAALP